MTNMKYWFWLIKYISYRFFFFIIVFVLFGEGQIFLLFFSS